MGKGGERVVSITALMIFCTFVFTIGVHGSIGVTSGSCVADGECVTSANYPLDYNNNEACTLTMQSSGDVTGTGDGDTYSWLYTGAGDKLNLRRRASGDYSGSGFSITNVYLEEGDQITWASDGITSLLQEAWKLCVTTPTAAPTTAPTAPTAAPTNYQLWQSSCCSSSCEYAYGSCGALQHTNDECWDGDVCVAKSTDDCCSTNGGAIAGIVIAVLVVVGGSIAGCCFLCSSCPGYKRIHKDERDAPAGEVQEAVPAAAQTGVPEMKPKEQAASAGPTTPNPLEKPDPQQV